MTTKSHFMHPAHALVLNRNTDDYNYLCSGCKTPGFGENFRCQPCNFDMHKFCIDCPRQLASFLHPQHQLNLMVQNSQFATSLTTCDVCGDSVNGLFYCCQYCNFNVHPICTQLPQFLCHTVHDLHHLAFQKPYFNTACSVCGDVCDSWRYRCGECNGFDVHIDCVTKPYVTTSPRASSATHGGSTSRRLPPHAGIYSYAGVTCSPTPTPNYHPNPHNMYGSYPYPCHYNPYSYHAGGSEYGQITYGSNMQNVHSPYSYNYAGGSDQYGQITYDSNMQNVHSHNVPAQDVESNSPQWGKIGLKVFSIVATLAGVASSVVFGF